MIGCTRCGRWHLDAEKAVGDRLSCTEVKAFWSRIKKEHQALCGHLPHITTNDSGDWICIKCKQRLSWDL